MAANVTPRRQQNQYNCVTTSLVMCLEAVGIPAAECQIDKVNAVLGAMPLRGASWEACAGAASHYGCRAQLVVPATLSMLREWTDAGCPAIIAYNLGNDWAHASVVYSVDSTHVFIADPNIPNPSTLTKKLTHDEFYALWWEKSGTGYKIRRPAMKIEREITPDGRQVIASGKIEAPKPIIYKRHGSDSFEYKYFTHDQTTGRNINIVGTGFKSEALALADFKKKLAEYYHQHPVTTKEMLQIVKNLLENSAFSMDDEGHDFVQFATRENGDMGSDSPWDDPDEDDDDFDSADHGGYGAHYGEQDMQAAIHFKKLLTDKLGPAVKIRIDTVDEWVSIHVQVFPNLLNKSASMNRETTPDARRVVASLAKQAVTQRVGDAVSPVSTDREILAIKINDRDKSIRINPDDVSKRNETHRDSLINPATGAQRSWGSGKHQNRDYDVAKGNRRRPKHPNQDREASALPTLSESERTLTAAWSLPMPFRSWFESDTDAQARVYANEIKLTQEFLHHLHELQTSPTVHSLVTLHRQTEDTGIDQPVMRRSLVIHMVHEFQKLAMKYYSQFSAEARKQLKNLSDWGTSDDGPPDAIPRMLAAVEKILPGVVNGRVGIPMFLKMLGINQSVFGV